MCDALHYLLDNIFIRFGSKLYKQIVGIPMGTNCASLVADLFLFCYERATVGPTTHKHQAPTHRLKLYVRAVIESEA